MFFIKCLLFNTAFFLWTAFIVVPFCFLWVCPRQWLVCHLKIWSRGVMFLLKTCVGITYEVVDGHLLPSGSALLVSNHQSTWDTIIFHVLTSDPCYVMKRILFFIPFYGQHAWKVGMIGISRRQNHRMKSLKRLLRQVPARLKRGQTVIIFPEGTRVSVDGYEEYNPGAFAVYNRIGNDPALQNCPTVPVALNSGRFWPKGAAKAPGVIKIRFLPTIRLGLNRQEFMKALEVIRDAQKKL